MQRDKRVLTFALGILVVAFFYSTIPSENLSGSAIYEREGMFAAGVASAEPYVLFYQSGGELILIFNQWPVNTNMENPNHVKISNRVVWFREMEPGPWNMHKSAIYINGNKVVTITPFYGQKTASMPLQARDIGKSAVLVMTVLDRNSESGVRQISRRIVIGEYRG